MKKLSFKFILNKLKKIKFSKFDAIVAIGTDGILPASLLRYFIDAPVYVIWINYRDVKNKPIREKPKLMKPLSKKIKSLKSKKILLVDTVSRTGKTLDAAKKILKENKIKTFLINGKADYNIINKKECFILPWS